MKVPQYVPAQSSCKFLVGISVTLVICLRRLNTMLPASSLSNGKVKKFALFFQVSWLSTNCLRSSKGGGGSVILVMRYAVDASATPYIKTPHRGILSRMKSLLQNQTGLLRALETTTVSVAYQSEPY